jgi:hypothetical protein
VDAQRTSFNDSLTVGGSYEYTSGDQTTDFHSYRRQPGMGSLINYTSRDSGKERVAARREQPASITSTSARSFAQYTIQHHRGGFVSAGGRFDHFGLNNTPRRRSTTEEFVQRVQPQGQRTYRLTGTPGDTTRPVVNVYRPVLARLPAPRAPRLLQTSDSGLEPHT